MQLEHLNPQERLFLTWEASNVRWYAIAVWICDRRTSGAPVRADEVVDVVASRIHLAPRRFRQRIVSPPFHLGSPVWVDDPTFDPRQHVVEHTGSEPFDRRGLQELVGEVSVEPIESDRPRWDLHLAHLRDGRLGVIVRAHHAMLDGQGLAMFASVICDLEAGDPADLDPPRPWSPTRWPTRWELFRGAAREHWRRIGSLWRLLSQRRAGADHSERRFRGTAAALAREFGPLSGRGPENDEVGRGRELTLVRCNLATVKRIAHLHSCTVNDVASAVVTSAIREWQQRNGLPTTDKKLLMPVNLDDVDASEHVGFMLVQVPVSEPDPVVRLKTIATETRSRKQQGTARRIDDLLQAVAEESDLAYRIGQRMIQNPREANLTLSDMPGVADRLCLRGAEVEEMYALVPLARHHRAGFSILSYAEIIHFCLTRSPDERGLLDGLSHCLDAAVRQLGTDYGIDAADEFDELNGPHAI